MTTDEVFLSDWQDHFQVSLPSNPTTGHMWDLVEKNHASIISRTADIGSRPGQGSVETFTFKLLAPRGCILTLRYKRPWEDAVVREHRIRVLYPRY